MSAFQEIIAQQANTVSVCRRIAALRDKLIGALPVDQSVPPATMPVSQFAGLVGDLENAGIEARFGVADALKALEELEAVFA